MAVKSDPGGFPQRKLKDAPTVTPGQMREIQRAAQEVFHYDILQPIENAGRTVAQLILAMFGGRGRGQRVVMLAGGGHVGAAGLCAARHLDNWGRPDRAHSRRSREPDELRHTPPAPHPRGVGYW